MDARPRRGDDRAVLDRRGFLLLLGSIGTTTAAGLWLPSTGVVALPGAMVLELRGTCSLCGETTPNVSVLAGALERSPRICDRCVPLAGDSIVDWTRTGERVAAALERSRAPVGADLETVQDALSQLRRPAIESWPVSQLPLLLPAVTPANGGSTDFMQARFAKDPRLRAALDLLRRTSTRIATTPEPSPQDIRRHDRAAGLVDTFLGHRVGSRTGLEPVDYPEACSFCDAPGRTSYLDEAEGSGVVLYYGFDAAACEPCIADAANLMARHLFA